VLAAQGSQKAAAQADRRMIVDAQVHLWKAETPDWKWVPGRQPQLPEPFTIERLVPMMDEAGVDRAVIVPPSWPGDRNDYAIEAVKRYPNRFRIMGRIPLQDPKSAELLPKWKEQPGMVGVRLTFNNDQTIPWLSDGTADWFWPAAEKAGLPVMCFTPGISAKLAPIAERHPRLPLILDHMGVSAALLKENKLDDALAQTVALAKYPNVSVKLSASPGISREPYPFRDVAGHIKRVFDAYGPQRSYWGTDLTNSYAKASYRQRVSHFTEELSFLSDSDKDWVMGRAITQRLGWT
jgi:predicted TIM-barrel fold metal-dependent hydrolase